MKKWVLGVLLFFLFLVPNVNAQERITSFDSYITVEKDGSIKVNENITYDFGSEYRHGIFRTIPFITRNAEGKKFELKIENIDVRTGLGPLDDLAVIPKEKFTVSRSGENVSIKIGDPDKTITGSHKYRISYTVRGALTYFADHDELYWNATGNEWPTPIESAKTFVTLPTEVDGPNFKVACYTGYTGSTSTDCSFSTQGKTASFVLLGRLESSQGLTVVVGFPKNMVAVLEPKPYMTFWETWYGKALGIIIFWGFAAISFYWYIAYPIQIMFKWLNEGRDPKIGNGQARAWYGPPTTKEGRKLTPAETGVLMDETADQKDISATVIDLARRGYLTIDERKKNDFYFKKGKAYDADLQGFERDLLSGIFSTKEDVRLKDKKLYTVVADVKKALYTRLVEDGFFPKDPEKIRTFYTVMGVFALFTANPLLIVSAFGFGRAMPRKSEYGAQAAQMARGLRNFLTSQERQLEHMAKNQINFEKLLPFAVAFGAEKIWAERFKDIELKEPEWYTGYSSGSRFNSVYLTDRLGSSFNTLSTSSTPPSSTGHSSGFSGGSSGGGGGGGGGGSW